MSDKRYFMATQAFVTFLQDIEGKLAKLALASGLVARTVARIKAGGRTNSANARDLHSAACAAPFHYVGTFETAFTPAPNKPKSSST
jgi:hypothetical protein